MPCPRIDFYLPTPPDQETAWRAAAKVIEKALAQQQSVIISCQTAAQMAAFDQWLWTWRDISFIPHGCWPKVKPEETPVLITTVSQLAEISSTPLLLNLSDTLPTSWQSFTRIFEVIPNQQTARDAARERYRYYREQQCELHSHTLS